MLRGIKRLYPKTSLLPGIAIRGGYIGGADNDLMDELNENRGIYPVNCSLQFSTN